jgi:hypothetical protein
MDERFAQALMQAASQRANLGGSPNGGGQEMTNLQNLAQLQFAEGGTGVSARAAGGAATNQANNEEKQRSVQEQIADVLARSEAAKAQFEADLEDPKNYKREIAEDGGYNFFNAKGEAISAGDYARARNERVADVLKDSQNSSDQSFLNDYKDTMELGRIMSTVNKEELKDFYKKRPGLEDYMKKNKIQTFDGYVNAFRNSYADKFTQGEARGATVAPRKTNLNLW